MSPIGSSLGVTLVLAFVACKGEAVATPPAAPIAKPPALPEWVTAAESESERFMTDRCADLVPPELAEPDNRDFFACVTRAHAAVERAWNRISERALATCVSTGNACCFEQVSEYDLIGRIVRGRFSSHTLYEDRKLACDDECSKQLGRSPDRGPSCQPHIIVAPHDPEHHRTAAVEAIVTECARSPAAISGCASLKGMFARDLCRRSCRGAAGDAGADDGGWNRKGPAMAGPP